MAKIMRQTLREQVTQAIRLKLLTGQLRPGERIVEQEMAEDLGVSRGPVREALRQIEQEGLVEYTSHVGCFVKEFNARDVYEVYLLRANLEILSVKMCDGKFSEQTIAKMEQIVQRMATIEQLEQFDEVIENDNQFHACIIEECGLKRLYTLWSSMDSGNTIVFIAARAKRICSTQSGENSPQGAGCGKDRRRAGYLQNIDRSLYGNNHRLSQGPWHFDRGISI